MTPEIPAALVEKDDERLERLRENPNAAVPEDVMWLTALVNAGFRQAKDLNQALLDAAELLKQARNQPGRITGLREAAALIRAAMNKEAAARFLQGKKVVAARAMNSALLANVANLIDRYAKDAEEGKV